MNRRGFLGGLAGLAAGMVLDPEKLLWVKGAKTIFIPEAAPLQRIPVGVMVNSGRVVFADEFYATGAKVYHDGFGEFVAGHFKGQSEFPIWIQTNGIVKMLIENYSPSLAS